MGVLLTGVVALPLTVLAYFAFNRLLPALLIEGDEAPAPLATRRRRSSRLARMTSLVWLWLQTRLGLGSWVGIAVLLGGLALFASRGGLAQRTSAPDRPGQPAPAAAAPAVVQLPEPQPLAVLRRIGQGSDLAQLSDPRDLVADSSGGVYVADAGNHRVIKFNADGSVGAQMTDTAAGKLVEPASLAILSNGIVVADGETGQLAKFDLQGRSVADFAPKVALYHPRGLLADPSGAVYVIDTGGNRLVRIGPDGNVDGDFGAAAKLDQPTGAALDDQRNLLVIQPDAKRLDRLHPDGTPDLRWSVPSTGTVRPPHLLWLPGHGLLMTLPNLGLLALYGPDGLPKATWTVTDQAEPLQGPLGLVLSPNKQSLFVLWNGSNQVTEVDLPAELKG